MRGRTVRTAIKRQAILKVISAGGTVAEAAAHAGVGRSSIFDWKAEDPAFARDFDAAYEAGTDRYEAEARRRAFTESDALLIFLLKARDPKRFNQKTLAIGGDPNNPVGVHHSGEVGSNVIFYMPSNGRDKPEEEDVAHDTIEGEASDSDDEAAA